MDAVAVLTGKRCLVLDDEYLIALDIQQILESAGAASVMCAASADEAVTALREGPPFDLAVLDIKLSGAAGSSSSSTIVAVRLSERGTPFVFLTGMRADEIRGEPFSGVPVVEKPYQGPALIEALRQALSTKAH